MTQTTTPKHEISTDTSPGWLALVACSAFALFASVGCQSALDGSPDTDRASGELEQGESEDDGKADKGSQQGDTDVSCPDPASSSSGKACTQVVTTCAHEASDKTCQYGNPCAVPDQLEQSDEWTCGSDDSESDDGDSAPQCKPADDSDSGACTQVVATCTHQPSDKECQYPTPCAIPDDYESSSDWSCDPNSGGSSAPQCKPADDVSNDQACIDVVANCTHKPSGESCQYATPCHIPEDYDSSSDWSCDPEKADGSSDDGGGDGSDGDGDGDDGSDDGSDAPTCPDASDSGDQICTQVVTKCTHEPSGETCSYSTPCAVPDELESDADWTCSS